MYKNELYKIVTKKSIYPVLLVIIVFMIYASNFSDMVMKDPIYEELHESWGGPITSDIETAARDSMRAADEEAANRPSTDIPTGPTPESNVHFLVAVAGMNSEELKEHKNSLRTEVVSHHGDSYEYREALKELEMLEELGEPNGFYLIRAWRGMLNLIEPFFGTLFLASLILIGLTPVFAEEHTQRTIGLISATKHGKRRIVTAKIMAALTYVLGVFIVLHLVNLVLQLNTHGGFEGWDAPIQSFIDGSTYSTSYQNSPFNWNIIQMHAITLSVQFFASVALAILVLLISSFIKNTMIAFFAGGAIFTAPFILTQLGLEEVGFFRYIRDFSYLELFKVQGLFESFKAYNLFGYPVLYPILAILIFIIITFGFSKLIYYRISKEQVNE